MTSRLLLACLVLAAGPALAQPAPAPPAPAQPAPARPAAPATADDMEAFQKDLDAMFVKGGLTADQAAARAGSVSPAVQRRVAELDASIASVQATELLQVPEISAKASYTRLSFIPPFRIANPMNPSMPFLIPFLQNTYDAQATIAVPLSDYVVRFPKDIQAARLGEDAARDNEGSARVDAAEDAREAYYEWVRAKLQVLIAQRQLVQVQTTLAQEKALFEVQRVSKADYLRLVSQAADAERTLDQLTQLAILREQQLRLLIGARDDEPLAIGEDIRQEVSVPEVASLDAMVKQAEHQRYDFRAVDSGIAAKESQRDAEKANMYPQLSAFATAEDARPNPRVFPQTDQFKFTWLAGIQLTWNFNQALISRSNLDRLAAEADELRADRAGLAQSTEIQILAAAQALELSVRSLQTTKEGLEAAEESYRVRKELLNAERATAVELVDAQTDLTRAWIAALNARVDLRVALAQLSHALGEDVKGR